MRLVVNHSAAGNALGWAQGSCKGLQQKPGGCAMGCVWEGGLGWGAGVGRG